MARSWQLLKLADGYLGVHHTILSRFSTCLKFPQFFFLKKKKSLWFSHSALHNSSMVSLSVLGGGRSGTSAFLIVSSSLLDTAGETGFFLLGESQILSTKWPGNLGLCQSEFPDSFHNHLKICHSSRSSKSECCIFTGNFIFCHQAANRN